MNAELFASDAGDVGLFEAMAVNSVDPPQSDCSAVIGFAVLHRPQMHAGTGYDGAGGGLAAVASRTTGLCRHARQGPSSEGA